MLSNVLLIISAILFVLVFSLAIWSVIFTVLKDHKTVIKLCNIAEILISFAVSFAVFGLIYK